MGEDAPGVVELVDRDQREGGHRPVARPHQMIAAERVAGVAPRRAHAGDHRTRIGAVLVHLEHRRRHLRLLVEAGIGGRRQREAAAPALPAIDEIAADGGVAFGERRTGEPAGAVRIRTEADGNDAGRIGKRCRQGDVAAFGAREGPGEAAMPCQILPTVRRADVTGTEVGHGYAGGQAEAAIGDTGIEGGLVDPRGVVVAGGTEMRRCDHAEAIRPFQRVAHEQHVAPRIGQELDRQPVVVAFMDDGEQRDGGPGLGQPIAADTLDIDPAVFADEIEADIAGFGTAGRRPVDLVDDAVADGCPQTGIAERRGDEVLVARRPGRCDAGRPKCLAFHAICS